MAEYIDKKALITEIQSAVSMVLQTAPYEKVWFDRFVDRQNEIMAIIERQPTAEVIRCRDCKHWSNHSICEVHSEWPDQYNTGHSDYTEPDDFCSYGERKEG